MAFNISYVYKAVDKFSSTADRIKRGSEGITRSVLKSTGALKKLGGALKKVGKLAAIGATLGLGFAAREYASFEQGLLGVAKTANIEIGPALDSLGDKFTALSKKMPISAVNLLTFGEAAAQMGVKGDKNILAFAETLGKLTSITDSIQGDVGAAKLARLINVTGGDLADVERYASAITSLGNSAAASEGEILEFATMIASRAGVFGITGQQALGLAASMREVGLQTELGSSSVARGLGAINEAISKGGSSLKNLSMLTGIAGKDLKASFGKDAIGVLVKFSAGMNKWQEDGKDVTKILSAFNLEGVRDITTLGTLANRINEVNGFLNQSNKAFSEGIALQKEYAVQATSLSNKYQLMKNNIAAVSKETGTIMRPSLQNVTENVSDIANTVANKLTPLADKAEQQINRRKLRELDLGINSGGVNKSRIDGRIMVESAPGMSVRSIFSKTTGNNDMSLGTNMLGAH